MDNLAKYGLLLYSLGICWAVVGAAKMPDPGETWPSTLFVFNDGLILTLLGLVLWKFAPVPKKKEEEGRRTAIQLLRDMEPILDDLYKSVDELECYQIQEYIKILREQYLVPLEDKRTGIMKKFGMEKAAELLIAISYGERILNRVYSASLDGHHDEAVTCTEEAHGAFQEVFALARVLWAV